ncbi:hypothetical protein O181_038545 [Austropuccinia psidii MF-1]|uniref:Uncharacterized protein n=1 Tax=Austropuccinia psidii MF-1 TaxID=1389203 RepID=A0A9Q3DD36_9BASI|nr:hypothetical protein [Austropuccinia psidii MF-1]
MPLPTITSVSLAGVMSSPSAYVVPLPRADIACLEPNPQFTINPDDCQSALGMFVQNNLKVYVTDKPISKECGTCKVTVLGGYVREIPKAWLTHAVSFVTFGSQCQGPPMNVTLTPEENVGPLAVEIEAGANVTVCARLQKPV